MNINSAAGQWSWGLIIKFGTKMIISTSNRTKIIIIKIKFIEIGRFLFINWLNPHSIEFIDWWVFSDLDILFIDQVMIIRINIEIIKILIIMIIILIIF